MSTKKHNCWTETKIFELLEKRFPAPAYVLLPQVRNSTGFSKEIRTVDAIAVSTWPSRGLYISGVEIKVTLADWRKELASPEKADAIQKYCTYWYVAAPKGVVQADEVPGNWGLIEVTAGSVLSTKPAKEVETQPVDLLFVAAVLRAASKVMVSTKVVEEKIADAISTDQYFREQAAKCEPLEYELRTLKETVSQFEEASGVKIANRWDAGRIGANVKLVMDNGLPEVLSAARKLRETASGIATRLDNAIDAMKGV